MPAASVFGAHSAGFGGPPLETCTTADAAPAVKPHREV